MTYNADDECNLKNKETSKISQKSSQEVLEIAGQNRSLLVRKILA